MIDHNKALDYEKNDEGEMLDEDGNGVVYCDACPAEATQRVVVSVDEPHDDTRNYCHACYEVYMVGVQHGRYHEAASHNSKPGRDSSQEPPQQV